MIRGTTTRFRFNIPYKVDTLEWVTIKFWQPGNPGTTLAPLPIIKKFNKPIDKSDNSYELTVTLSAEETARFSDKFKVRVQLRAANEQNAIFACKEQLITVYPMNDDIIEENPDLGETNDEGYVILDGKPIIQWVGDN